MHVTDEDFQALLSPPTDIWSYKQHLKKRMWIENNRKEDKHTINRNGSVPIMIVLILKAVKQNLQFCEEAVLNVMDNVKEMKGREVVTRELVKNIKLVETCFAFMPLCLTHKPGVKLSSHVKVCSLMKFISKIKNKKLKIHHVVHCRDEYSGERMRL